MTSIDWTQRVAASARHRTAYAEAGPADGPLIVFLHGWPETGLVWRHQVEHFAAAGWRCVAPDLRGYGGSSVPADPAAYAVREAAADMAELHDALGGRPAVWVGHDWGGPVAWAMASHHPGRCRGVASLCVPHLPGGFTLPNLVALVDRGLYPADRYPVGQWDYWLFYREEFARAAADFEADVPATLSAVFRAGSPAAGQKPAFTADIRARGGWFGPARRAPTTARDESLLSGAEFDRLVAAFRASGFAGANAWYVNDEPNAAYAAAAPGGGLLTLPALFMHAAWDTVCRTIDGRLANPMRASCSDLTETTVDAGHMLTLERPAEVNAALGRWLDGL